MKDWEMRRGDISDLTSQQGAWRGWRQLMICTFCRVLPGSSAQKTVPLLHSQSETHAHPHSCLLISSPHTLGPSLPRLSLSSQRHKDIFISYKARTLMKHWWHKYISMNFHIAVAHYSISVWCCEHKLSQCVKLSIIPSCVWCFWVIIVHLK